MVVCQQWFVFLSARETTDSWRSLSRFMVPDDTPLLSENLNDVYLRFSSSKKNIILGMLSACDVINCMSISSESAWRSLHYLFVDSLIAIFTPSIPQIAKDLNSTGAVVK